MRTASGLRVVLVIAALSFGSSSVMTVGGGPRLLGLPAFGVLGLLGAAAGGVWRLRAVRRGAHRRGDNGDDD